jgi:signal transduction histidine kinase
MTRPTVGKTITGRTESDPSEGPTVERHQRGGSRLETAFIGVFACDVPHKQWRDAAWFTVGIFLTAFIGWVDFETGYDFSLTIFYLVPIIIVSLRVGAAAGSAIGVTATLAGLLSDFLLPHPFVDPRSLYWNAVIRLTIYLVVVLTFAALHRALMVELAQRRELEELHRLKDSLLGIAAHDLRSPLVVIGMYANNLLNGDDPLSEHQRRFLAVIEKKIAFMSRLVNDTLDLARIEAGKLDLCVARRDYPSFLREQADLLGETGRERGVTVVVEVPDDLPPLGFDADRIEQVLSNLIGNGLKFSPPGSTLRVSVSREGGEVVTSVIDQGPGIRCEEKEKLFQPFHQGEAPPGGEKGTGLGLAIVRKVIEAHGGSVGVESEPGKGATFRFSIPLEGRDPTSDATY